MGIYFVAQGFVAYASYLVITPDEVLDKYSSYSERLSSAAFRAWPMIAFYAVIGVVLLGSSWYASSGRRIAELPADHSSPSEWLAVGIALIGWWFLAAGAISILQAAAVALSLATYMESDVVIAQAVARVAGGVVTGAVGGGLVAIAPRAARIL